MKRYLFFCIFSLVSVYCAAEKPTTIVRDFYNNLNTLVEENDYQVHQRIINMCNSGFRASDRLSVEQEKIQSPSIDINEYIRIITDCWCKFYIDDDNIKIMPYFNNYRTVNIPNCTAVEVRLRAKANNPKNYFDPTNLHIIVYINSMGKICAIGDYETDIHKKANSIPKVSDVYFTYEDLSGTHHNTTINKMNVGEISYLYIHATLSSSINQTDTIWIRILGPNKSFKNGYTSRQKISLEAGEKEFAWGFGNQGGGLYKTPGVYTWELWFKGEQIAVKQLTIEDHQYDISDVQFAAKYGGVAYNDYGTSLCESDIRTGYLYTKIKFKNPIIEQCTLFVHIDNNGKEDQYPVCAKSGDQEVEVKCGDRYMSGTIKCMIKDGNKKELYRTNDYIYSGSKPRLEYRYSTLESGTQIKFDYNNKIELKVDNSDIKNWHVDRYPSWYDFHIKTNKNNRTITISKNYKTKGRIINIWVVNDDNKVKSNSVSVYDNR